MSTKNPATIRSVMRDYLLSQELSRAWHRQIEYRVGKLVEWLGRDIRMEDLKISQANEWLLSLEGSEILPNTIHGYRTALHAVWLHAYMEGLSGTHPMRLRRINRKPRLVEAYTHEHLRALRKAATQLNRNIEGTLIPRSLWWGAYIPAAYSTGLRKGCLLALERGAIQKDGTVVVIAQKTKKIHTRRIDAIAMTGISEIAKLTPTRLAFPFARAEHAFFEDFRQIVDMSGVPEHSTSKWLRRSAISYAEAAQAGSGRLLGGHATDEVTNKSYRDFKIAPEPVIEPPAIDWGGES